MFRITPATATRTTRNMNDKLLLISNTIGCSLLLLLALLLLSNSLFSSFAEAKAEFGTETKADAATEQDFEELGLHYGKYLKEVVAALDKDQKFTETIKNMDANDIKTGKVADQLKHVHEDVRKRLNDLKYLEIKRLRDLATRKNEIEQYGETYHGSDKRKWRTLGASLSEVDHLHSHSSFFDEKDLHKLMVAATNDLEKIDKERKEDFKTYEMEREWQFQERLKMMNETEKQEAIKLRQQLKEKHDDHAKVHEPGRKQQFEEVWEKKDHLPKAEFDPKTFFNLHDTNSDNHWDQEEVRKLLSTEISKLYDASNPEDDPNEMEEEYERMREHVYKEIDTDHNGLISKEEFIAYSKKPEFSADNGWEDVSKKKAYSDQEYENYLKDRDRMMRQNHGHYDPAYYANQPANLHLPDWGLGMPAGAHPSQYYGYQVDPNHPHAQQIMAQQQQMAYHQQAQAAAYQQHAAAYQQPPAVAPQAYQQPNQQYYQAPPQAHPNQQQVPQIQQQQPAAQVNYQAPQQQIQQPQQVPQQVPQVQSPPSGQPQQQAQYQYQAPQPASQQISQQQQQQQQPIQTGNPPQPAQAVPVQQQAAPPQQNINYQQPPVQQSQQANQPRT